jgi:hypothetical protein
MLNPLTTLSRTAWTIIAGVLVVVLLLAILSVRSWQDARQDAARAVVRGELQESEGAAGKNAAVINDRAQAGAAATEQLSRESADAIRNACPGPDCDRVTYERLCKRKAYRDRDFCLRPDGRSDDPGAR